MRYVLRLQQLGDLVVDKRLDLIIVFEILLHADVRMDLEPLFVDAQGSFEPSNIVNQHSLLIELPSIVAGCSRVERGRAAFGGIQIIVQCCVHLLVSRFCFLSLCHVQLTSMCCCNG